MKPRTIIVVFVVALLVRLSGLLLLLPQLRPDQNPDYYRELGRNVALGKGFVATAPDGRELPNINRPPGYPLFLAALMTIFGDRLAVLLVANCVLAAVGCALTVVLASRWLRPGAAMVAGLLTVVEPNSVLRCCLVMTEPLFVLFLLAGLCVLVWWRENNYAWWLCGLLWGLATLCRAVAMWVPLVAIAAALLWRMRPRCVIFFLIGFLPLVGLWIGRNELLTGHSFFSSSSKNVMVTGWAASLEAERTGISVDVARDRLLERTGSIEFFDGRERFEKTQQEQAKVLHETLGATSPWRLAAEMVWGTAQTLVGPGGRMLETFLREPKPTPRWWQFSYMGMLLVFVTLAVYGAVRRWRKFALLTILVLYFVALSVGPFGNSRFRYPIIPLLAILAVAACAKPNKSPVDATESLHHRN
jgi:4-amino-4-deoxy-L-arabinose transferase-like glycosyltransferase